MDKKESAKILFEYVMRHPSCYACQHDWFECLQGNENLYSFSEENARVIRKHASGEFD